MESLSCCFDMVWGKMSRQARLVTTKHDTDRTVHSLPILKTNPETTAAPSLGTLDPPNIPTFAACLDASRRRLGNPPNPVSGNRSMPSPVTHDTTVCIMRAAPPPRHTTDQTVCRFDDKRAFNNIGRSQQLSDFLFTPGLSQCRIRAIHLGPDDHDDDDWNTKATSNTNSSNTSSCGLAVVHC